MAKEKITLSVEDKTKEKLDDLKNESHFTISKIVDLLVGSVKNKEDLFKLARKEK